MSELLLGKPARYQDQYNPACLFAIKRATNRQELNIGQKPPFDGADIWNAYEVSWLNPKGKPCVAIATITVPCDSPFLIESKSMKLYFNSFNQSRFSSFDEVTHVLCQDLSAVSHSKVLVALNPLDKPLPISHWQGDSIDHLDVAIDQYQPTPELLTVSNEPISETLTSNLLKSNCLVTGQPDWASIQISYQGPKINHAGLLKYLISFRQHNEFHEQCVERIFMALSHCCKPKKLAVYARFTRRGGIDINPWRANYSFTPQNTRLVRQ